MFGEPRSRATLGLGKAGFLVDGDGITHGVHGICATVLGPCDLGEELMKFAERLWCIELRDEDRTGGCESERGCVNPVECEQRAPAFELADANGDVLRGVGIAIDG